MDTKQIAETILEQLGGNRFIAMTGAHQFVTVCCDRLNGIRGGLRFRLPMGKMAIICVDLIDTDTYEVRAYGRKTERKVFSMQGVDAGDLRRVIRNITGLDLSL
jgi:hypothetical protein